jgi:hypothetical protein
MLNQPNPARIDSASAAVGAPTQPSVAVWIFRDGVLILNNLLALFCDYKRLTFFAAIGDLLIAVGFLPGILVLFEVLKTDLVLRVPWAVLLVGWGLSGLHVKVGLILHKAVRHPLEFSSQLQALADGCVATLPAERFD